MIGNAIYVKVLVLPSDKENKLFNKDKLKAIGLLEPTGKATSSPTKSTPQKQSTQASQSQKKSDKNIIDF